VMATVSTYLVVIASGLVRDIYQRFLRPAAGDNEIRRVSHIVMILFGVIGVVANIRPVGFLQTLIIFSTTSTASAFVAPALMLAFWRRATAAGTIAAMVVGAGTNVSYSLARLSLDGPSYDQWSYGLEPIVWGLAASAITGVVVSLFTSPPPAELVSSLFDAQPATRQGSASATT
jgi:sodium/pantothenate symporter